jgi:hypothetical protein
MRRRAILATLALCGAAFATTAPLSSEAPTMPVQCPPHPLLTQYEGNFYVWLPNPSGDPCWISIEVPGSIKKPASSSPTVYPPQPCPTHVILTQYDGNYYVWLPNPTGQTCWISIEVPVSISRSAVGAATPNPPIDGCPTEPIAYESNGHDYVWEPDPNGTDCRQYMELPVTVPPTLR